MWLSLSFCGYVKRSLTLSSFASFSNSLLALSLSLSPSPSFGLGCRSLSPLSLLLLLSLSSVLVCCFVVPALVCSLALSVLLFCPLFCLAFLSQLYVRLLCPAFLSGLFLTPFCPAFSLLPFCPPKTYFPPKEAAVRFDMRTIFVTLL